MRLDRLILRHIDVIRRQCRATDAGQIQIELEMPLHAKGARDLAGGVELLNMTLAVIDAERMEREAVALRNRRGRVRIQAAAQKNTRSGTAGSRLTAPGPRLRR